MVSGLDDNDRARVLAALMVLRIQSAGEPLSAFFPFDPRRTAILLCPGNKVGKEKHFYHEMIPLADRLLTEHLQQLTEKE
ncbi:hypothetical protein [Pantoea phytobeneficialis]|uniref:hypothetical protein n=1 Tax=Pantoea phytobeneficialis TaxID=2052056 RepID=UPI003F593CF9